MDALGRHWIVADWTGSIMGASLPEGTGKVLHRFDNPRLLAMAAVPGQVEVVSRPSGVVPHFPGDGSKPVAGLDIARISGEVLIPGYFAIIAIIFSVRIVRRNFPLAVTALD